MSRKSFEERIAAKDAGVSYENIQFTQPLDQEIQALQKRTADKFNWHVADAFLRSKLVGLAFSHVGFKVSATSKQLFVNLIPQISDVAEQVQQLVALVAAESGFDVDEVFAAQEVWLEESKAIYAKYNPAEGVDVPTFNASPSIGPAN